MLRVEYAGGVLVLFVDEFGPVLAVLATGDGEPLWLLPVGEA